MGTPEAPFKASLTVIANFYNVNSLLADSFISHFATSQYQ